MPEYIEREALRDELLNISIDTSNLYGCGVLEGLDRATKRLNEQPAADVTPVRHGRWEQVKSWSTKAKYRCSVCGREIMSAAKVNIEKYPYCHCGAKMDSTERS